MNKCEKCGFLHYRTDPCRGPRVRIGTDGLTAKETPKSDVSASPPSFVKAHTQSTAPRESRARRSRSANESLPVDTNSGDVAQWIEREHPRLKVDGSNPSVISTRPASSTGSERRNSSPKVEGSNPSQVAKPRGRPRIHTDRKAAKAMYERNRRARLKNA